MVEAEIDSNAANPVGERLRSAREAQGMSLDDVATRTRVPIRHLEHIERGEWDLLPATTYCVGFARSYANAVGLNGSEIGNELREQLGGQNPRHGNKPVAGPTLYEPADPARVPPRSLALVAAAVALLLVVGYFVWRSGKTDETDIGQAEVAAVAASPIVAPAPAPLVGPSPAPAAATGPVVLTATEDVWLRVYEANGGPRLREGMLKAGERYEVPATAQRPLIRTGRPDGLRVTVGQTVVPALGPPERAIADVSLLPADLMARAQGGLQPAPSPLSGAQPVPSAAGGAVPPQPAAATPQ